MRAGASRDHPFLMGEGILADLAPRLTSLHLSSVMLSQDFTRLGQLRRLRDLSLTIYNSDCKLGTDQMEVLGSLPELNRLLVHHRGGLPGMPVSSAALQLSYTSLAFLQCSKLQDLYMPLTRDILRTPVPSACKLQQLHLQGGKGHDQLYIPASLASLSSLQGLTFERMTLIGQLEGLASLLTVTALEMREVWLPEEDVNYDKLPAAVLQLTQLQSLYVRSSQFRIDMEALHPLTSLTKLVLKDLRARYPPVAPRVLSIPSQLAGLEWLDLGFNALQSLPHGITQLPRLATLKLRSQEVRHGEAVAGQVYMHAGLQLDQRLADIVCKPSMKLLALGQVHASGHAFSDQSLYHMIVAQEAMLDSGSHCYICFEERPDC